MDMLPKVLFSIFRPYSPPQVLEAKMSSEEVIFSGVEVNEYDRVEITFTSSNTDDLLRMESYNSEEVTIIQSSITPVTIMGGNNSEHMLVPGYYQFEVITKTNRYFSYYYVKSKDFSDESLINLRRYLENLLNGLSYDLIKQRLGMATPISDLSPTLLQSFQFLSKYKKVIKSNLDLIDKDPIMDLRGEYRLSKFSKRPDYKSIRWQAKKGAQRNSFSHNPTLFYEKHSKLTYLNVENQWIRYIILYFLQTLRKLEISFQKESLNLDKKMSLQENNLIRTRNQIKSTKSYGYERTLVNFRNTEKRIQDKLQELSKEKQNYLDYIQFLREITYYFTEYENSFWLDIVPEQKPKKVSQRLLRDYRYRKVYSLYKELFKLETKKIDSNIAGIQFRRTWQLFEYYNLGLVIDILRDNGYIWTGGWLANKDNPNQHIGTLPPDTILRFDKPNANHYIEVAYDTEVESNIIDRSYSRYFNPTGRRPDIRITIYNEDNTLYTEKAGLIIESKCRRHKYIINENIDPDVKWQLKDFLKLDYFDSTALEKGETPVKNPIKQVIVLYPKQPGMIPVKADHLYGESLLYIQIDPNDPLSNEKPYGYNSLKERVELFLSQVERGEGVNDK
ncbi:hypothetical protein FZC74_16685 [Sutcliffiella horikoshii]|uniref:DUF2357 domain-containing protein n=1 Tax=Sutcliffiella horikoshii TaxID=79883 RepID=A0AA94WQ02_9BACI|nr:hypothetical protein [Sutcliffiella horikoshii]TYS57327.1 hypothetical protein FZC74_16685 [Sutcliffiella horikoshii]